ncbi:MAG: hypothetical protein ABW061_08225 [Polyangiaceae bacterium]
MPASDHSAFFSRSPFAWLYFAGGSSGAWARAAVALACAALAMGCTPKIGDECTVSTNCSVTGDRLCDITQPGGYCTIFNCEPDTCPEDSACINFGTNLSPVGMSGECSPSQGNSPYQRSFCMASCGSDSDCRAGYACRDLNAPNPLGAVLAEYSKSGKVCIVPWHDPPAETGDGGVSTAVCTGADAGVGDN